MNNITCPNCGSTVTLNDGRTKGFCGNCGTPVELRETLVTPNTPSPAKTKKKRRFIKPIAIIVAAVAVLGAGAYFVLPALAGNSYQKAETAFLKGLLPQSDAKEQQGTRLNLTADFTAGEYIRAHDWLGDTTIEGTISQFAQMALADITVSAEGADLNVVGTYDGKNLTLSYPDLTSYYLRWLVNGGDNGNDEATTLDTDKLKKSAANFMTEYFKMTEKVAEVEKGVELSGGDVSVKCDKYTLEFTYEMVDKLARVLIREARDNDNLMEFAAATGLFGGYKVSSDGTRYTPTVSDVEDVLDRLEEALDDNDLGLDEEARFFRMAVWVKGNKVVAREIDKIYRVNGAKLTYQHLDNGKAAYINFALKDFGYFSASAKGDFTKANGAWDGTIKGSLKYDDEYNISATAKVTSLKLADKKMDGDIKLTVSGVFDDSDFDKITADLSFANSGNEQSFTLAVKQDADRAIMYGRVTADTKSIDYGKLALTYSTDKISALDLPEYDKDKELAKGSIGFSAKKDYTPTYNSATGQYEYIYEETPEERQYNERRDLMQEELDSRVESGQLDKLQKAYDEYGLMYYLIDFFTDMY